MSSRPNARISIIWFPIAMLGIFALSLTAGWFWYISMPAASWHQAPPALSAEERELAARLRAHVTTLAANGNGRNMQQPGSLESAAAYIEQQMLAAGLRVGRQSFSVRGKLVDNVIGIGSPAIVDPDDRSIFVIGAHYDTVLGTPGADDNASGIAAMLELGRRLQADAPDMVIHYVAFANEEAPFFATAAMGSVQYVERVVVQGNRVRGMFSLEMLGYYSDDPGSQHYPMRALAKIYPDTGNFVAFVGNARSRQLVRHAIGGFRSTATIASQGIAAPQLVVDAGRSDNWAFWTRGIAALMVTDTANFRNPHYHRASDTADTLNYEAMARVVMGLDSATRSVVRELRNRD